MMPDIFWSSTLREVQLFVIAYQNRKLFELSNVREINYLHYCLNTKPSDRVSIYEFMPLHGDPSKEEIEAMQRGQENEQVRLYKEAQAFYEQSGIQF